MKLNQNLRDWLEALMILGTMFAVIALPHPADAQKATVSVGNNSTRTAIVSKADRSWILANSLCTSSSKCPR